MQYNYTKTLREIGVQRNPPPPASKENFLKKKFLYILCITIMRLNKMKNTKIMSLGLIAILIVSVVLISGCTSDRTYEQPSKVTEPTTTPTQEETTPSEIPTTTQEEQKPKVQTFNVGETATDGELKVTVNNVRYTTKIDEQNNEFLVAEASPGKQYVIVDITVENILPDKTQTISTMMSTEIIDSEGYTYNLDFTGLTALDKAFKDGDLLPGMKKRGELAYEVPTSAKGLKFAYKFDLLGTTALFNLE